MALSRLVALMPEAALAVTALLVFLGTLRTFPLLAAVVVVALTVTLAYSIRVIVTAFFGRAHAEHPGVADIGWFLAMPRAVLVAFLLLFGFAPRLILDIIEPATRSLVRVLS